MISFRANKVWHQGFITFFMKKLFFYSSFLPQDVFLCAFKIYNSIYFLFPSFSAFLKNLLFARFWEGIFFCIGKSTSFSFEHFNIFISGAFYWRWLKAFQLGRFFIYNNWKLSISRYFLGNNWKLSSRELFHWFKLSSKKSSWKRSFLDFVLYIAKPLTWPPSLSFP